MTLDISYLVEQHIDWIAAISALEEVSFWVPDRTLIESDRKRPRHWQLYTLFAIRPSLVWRWAVAFKAWALVLAFLTCVVVGTEVPTSLPWVKLGGRVRGGRVHWAHPPGEAKSNFCFLCQGGLWPNRFHHPSYSLHLLPTMLAQSIWMDFSAPISSWDCSVHQY